MAAFVATHTLIISTEQDGNSSGRPLTPGTCYTQLATLSHEYPSPCSIVGSSFSGGSGASAGSLSSAISAMRSHPLLRIFALPFLYGQTGIPTLKQPAKSTAKVFFSRIVASILLPTWFCLSYHWWSYGKCGVVGYTKSG